MALASSRIQPWNASRVGSSKTRTSSSISVGWVTFVAFRVAPSPSFGPARVPGVNSM